MTSPMNDRGPAWVVIHDLENSEWRIALRVGGTDTHWTTIATFQSQGWAERVALLLNEHEAR